MSELADVMMAISFAVILDSFLGPDEGLSNWDAVTVRFDTQSMWHGYMQEKRAAA